MLLALFLSVAVAATPSDASWNSAHSCGSVSEHTVTVTNLAYFESKTPQELIAIIAAFFVPFIVIFGWTLIKPEPLNADFKGGKPLDAAKASPMTIALRCMATVFVLVQRLLYLLSPGEFDIERAPDLTNLVLSSASVAAAIYWLAFLVYKDSKTTPSQDDTDRTARRIAGTSRAFANILIAAAWTVDVTQRTGTLTVTVGYIGVFLLVTAMTILAFRENTRFTPKMLFVYLFTVAGAILLWPVQTLRPCQGF